MFWDSVVCTILPNIFSNVSTCQIGLRTSSIVQSGSNTALLENLSDGANAYSSSCDKIWDHFPLFD